MSTNNKFKVELVLDQDTPNSISFDDTYEGLNDKEWYKFTTDEFGGVLLEANQEGYEHLARYFLKLARTEKVEGFHSHHALEFGEENNGEPELTVMVVNNETES